MWRTKAGISMERRAFEIWRFRRAGCQIGFPRWQVSTMSIALQHQIEFEYRMVTDFHLPDLFLECWLCSKAVVVAWLL